MAKGKEEPARTGRTGKPGGFATRGGGKAPARAANVIWCCEPSGRDDFDGSRPVLRGKSMNVEYTGRQYEITPDIRKQIEHGLHKLTRILGDSFESKVILGMQKSRCKAEITISTRVQPVVGIAESTEMTSAVGEALE